MKAEVKIANIQTLGVAVKFGDTGDILHKLTIECVLKPGELDRILLMFRERAKSGAPVECMFTSPQARFDLKFETIEDKKKDKKKDAEPVVEPAKVAFEKVDMSFIEGAELPFTCKIDELPAGEGKEAREACLAALVGGNVIQGFKSDINEDGIIDQISLFLVENYPLTQELASIVYALKNNTFDIPEKAVDAIWDYEAGDFRKPEPVEARA